MVLDGARYYQNVFLGFTEGDEVFFKRNPKYDWNAVEVHSAYGLRGCDKKKQDRGKVMGETLGNWQTVTPAIPRCHQCHRDLQAEPGATQRAE